MQYAFIAFVPINSSKHTLPENAGVLSSPSAIQQHGLTFTLKYIVRKTLLHIYISVT